MTERIKASDFLKSYAIDTSSRRGLRAVELKSSKPQPKRKRAQKVMRDGFEETKDGFSLTIGLVTRSEGNKRGSEHWTVTHKVKNEQKETVRMLWLKYVGDRHIKPPCTVTFTRYAPKTLDVGENDRMWAKTIKDVVCNELIGVDDGSPLYTFKYKQQLNKEYGVKIELCQKK